MKTRGCQFSWKGRNKHSAQYCVRRALKCFRNRRSIQSAFTLTEVVVSVAITAIVFVSLYASIARCFGVAQLDRENVRATQILQEKMEVARLYTWTQISGGHIPKTFAAPYIEGAATGLTYTGRVSIIDAPIKETYAADMRQIHIDLTWSSGGVTHKREMTTFVTKYGLQNYLYND